MENQYQRNILKRYYQRARIKQESEKSCLMRINMIKEMKASLVDMKMQKESEKFSNKTIHSIIMKINKRLLLMELKVCSLAILRIFTYTSLMRISLKSFQEQIRIHKVLPMIESLIVVVCQLPNKLGLWLFLEGFLITIHIIIH